VCVCVARCDNAFDRNYRGDPSGYFAKEIHICFGMVCISFQVWGFAWSLNIFTYKLGYYLMAGIDMRSFVL